MVIEYYLLISSLLVTVSIFIATLYRIKIEKVLIAIQYKNARAIEKLRILKLHIIRDKEDILNMNNKDFLALLEEICNED